MDIGGPSVSPQAGSLPMISSIWFPPPLSLSLSLPLHVCVYMIVCVCVCVFTVCGTLIANQKEAYLDQQPHPMMWRLFTIHNWKSLPHKGENAHYSDST